MYVRGYFQGSENGRVVTIGVHIECHMNRFEYCNPDNNSDNDSFGSFLSKKSYLCNITRC